MAGQFGDGVMMGIGITIFPNTSAQTAQFFDLTESDLAERLADPKSYASKKDCPLIKLGRFGDQRSSKGAIRNDDNLIAVTGAEGDYDGEKIPMREACQ